MRMDISPIERSVGIAAALVVILAAAAFMSQEAIPSERGVGETVVVAQASDEKAPAARPGSQDATEKQPEIDNPDDLIKRAEIRSYENKMMARQLIRLVRWVIGILLVIAVLISLSLWMLGRQRAVPQSDLSAEITSTLVAVEERQAKLTNILREIQQEIDYIHSMSVPDLKKLIEQAERYIEQNEKDLGSAAAARKAAGKGETAKPNASPKPV